MSRYYSFRWKRNARTEAQVIFAPTTKVHRLQLVELIDNDVREELWPEQLIIIVPDVAERDYLDEMKKMLEDNVILRVKNGNVGLAIVTYDFAGSLKFHAKNRLQGVIDFGSADSNACVQAGIRQLAIKREAIIRSSPGHHFVHPNKSHSEGFLRASNLLVQANEIDFLAFSVLKYLQRPVEKIWIDSSSIASLIYAACLLRKIFEPTFDPPEIQSFSSYDGIALLKNEDRQSSLVFISATATGRLRSKIITEAKISEDNIITLFSANAGDRSSATIYDMRLVAEEIGSPPMDVFSEGDCPLCRSGSRAVELLGDQFLADSFKSIPYTLRQADAPDGLDQVMERYRARKAFVLEFGDNSHVLNVRLAPVLAEGQTFIEALVDRFISVSTTHIVALEDDDSLTLAEALSECVAKVTGKNLAVVTTLGGLEGSEKEAVNGIVIAAGCIGSGRALHTVSRELRDFGNKPRTFLIGLAKHLDGVDYKKLISDLQHNNDHHKHVVEIMDRMDLPYPNGFDAWNAERDFLTSMRAAHNLGRRDFSALLGWIDKRIATISGNLEGDSLFLPTLSNQDLRLRPTFAFWKDYDPAKVDQLDVFATIGSVLEHARRTRGKDGLPPLARSAFFANVLHWENFSRYNDGVIQASLLRAALPHELNYATDIEHSQVVSKILVKIFDRAKTQHGEAALEFAVALVTGRLRLRSEEIESLVLLTYQSEWDELIAGMLRHAFERPPEPEAGQEVPS